MDDIEARNYSKSSELRVPVLAMEDKDGITPCLPDGCSDNANGAIK